MSLPDPKGFFGIKERTLSIGNQFDQESTHHEFDQWVGSGASSTERVGSTHLQLDRAGRLKGELRLTGGQDPLDSSTRPRQPTSAESAVSLLPRESRFGDDAASELWAPPTDRVPNYDSVSTDIRTKFTTATEERLIRMTRTAPSPHDHLASV
ncbi:unnamed protein product [Lampetra fluviatilis]